MSFDFRTNASPTINLNLDEEEAVPKCENGPGCTHFTWTLFNGGTCWMKKGRLSRNGSETITIKADDPNSFCAKLAKFAKISGTDLNWYDFSENDEYPAPPPKEHLTNPTRCSLTPPPPPPPPPPLLPSSKPNNIATTTTTTTPNGNTIRCKAAGVLGSCTSSTNSLNQQCLKNYTWRLINEAATLKRKLVLGAQQQKHHSRQSSGGGGVGGLYGSIGGSSCESISSVLIELENKRTVSSIEATQVKIEREQLSPVPIVCEPIDNKPPATDRALEKKNLIKDSNQQEENETTTNQRTLPTTLKKPATSTASGAATANIITANCANKKACANGNTIWLGIQTSNTPPDSIEPSSSSSSSSSNNNQATKPTTLRKPKIEIIDGNNRRWVATVDPTSKTPIALNQSSTNESSQNQSSGCCCGHCSKSLVRATPTTAVSKPETMIVPVAVPVPVAKELCTSVWLPNRCNSNSSSNFAANMANCLNNSINSNCELNFPRHDGSTCSAVFCPKQDHLTPPPPPPPPVITSSNNKCFCCACDPPLPPPPTPQSLPVISQATQSAIAAASAPLLVANPQTFPHLHFHIPHQHHPQQDEYVEPSSSPLVDNYNILAPTRKNTENAVVSLSQMQQLQQQQQSTCQCGGACQNLNISDSNDLVPYTLSGNLLKSFNFGSSTNPTPNGDDEVVCYCENCTGGINNDVSQALSFVDPNSNTSILQLLASMGINPAMFLQQIQQQQQQQQLDQSQFIEPQLNYDLIPVNAQQALVGNEFELVNNNPCNFCCDTSGFEYVIC